MFFFIQPVFAEETDSPEKPSRNYLINISPQFGFFYGQAEEIVYSPGQNFKSDLHSQLLWDMKPVLYYGLLINFSKAKPFEKWGFFSNLSLIKGISGKDGFKSGIMENRDWLSVENDALTHFSTHDNYTKNLFFLDFNFGFSIPFINKILLKPLINISYMKLGFYGMDGHGIYARERGANTNLYYPIDDNPIRIQYEGKVINYSQVWFLAAPGIALDYHFLKNFNLELSFQISPLIMCAALDEHITTKTQFRDQPRGGLFLRPALQFSFSFKEIFSLALDFSWRYFTNAKGNAYKKNYGSGFYSDAGTSGAGLSLFNTALLFKIKL